MSIEEPVEIPVAAPASFGRRYAAKLAANIGSLVVGAVVILTVPRSLGAADYGLADYLLFFFTQATGILDVGTSIGFYAWFSRRPDDAALVRGYGIFVLAAGLALLLFVLLAFGAGQPALWFWPGAGILYVLCGALAGWLTWTQTISQKMFDARALTMRGETIIFLCKAAGAVLLLVLMLTRLLTLRVLLAYMILLPLATTAALLVNFGRETMTGLPAWRAIRRARPQWSAFVSDFRPYIVPLLGYTVVSNLSLVADRTLLQHFGGSYQQGLFALGNRISVLCLVFSMAMTQLLTREIAIAWDRQDRAEVGRLFSRFVPPLYALSALIAAFVALHAREVVVVMGGQQFAAGAAAMVVVAFYPMHQTLGQLVGSVYYATAKTRLYGNLGMVTAAVSLTALWLLVAPPALGGLGLGAVGLAIKLVLVQAVMVNVSLWFVSRHFPIRFGRQILFQILSPAIACALVFAADFAVKAFLPPGLVALLVSGGLYGLMALLIGMALPFAFGLSRRDIDYGLTHARTLAFGAFRRGI